MNYLNQINNFNKPTYPQQLYQQPFRQYQPQQQHQPQTFLQGLNTYNYQPRYQQPARTTQYNYQLLNGIYYNQNIKLGSGGEGAIYQVQNFNTKMMCIAKLYFEKYSYQADISIHNKFKSLQNYDTAPIIKMEDNFEEKHEKKYYAIFNKLHKDLYKGIIESKAMLSLVQFKHISHQILKGIQFLHDGGYVHQDIKPENIMLNNPLSNYQVPDISIIDFGFTVHKSQLLTSCYCGTLEYSCIEALEQDRQKIAVSNCKYDIWSIGCVLYELCTGDQLFRSESDTNGNWTRQKQAQYIRDRYSHIVSTIKSKKLLNSHIDSHNLQDLIINMIAYDPAKRFNAHQCLEHKFFIGEIQKPIILQHTKQQVPQFNIAPPKQEYIHIQNIQRPIPCQQYVKPQQLGQVMFSALANVIDSHQNKMKDTMKTVKQEIPAYEEHKIIIKSQIKPQQKIEAQVQIPSNLSPVSKPNMENKLQNQYCAQTQNAQVFIKSKGSEKDLSQSVQKQIDLKHSSTTNLIVQIDPKQDVTIFEQKQIIVNSDKPKMIPEQVETKPQQVAQLMQTVKKQSAKSPQTKPPQTQQQTKPSGKQYSNGLTFEQLWKQKDLKELVQKNIYTVQDIYLKLSMFKLFQNDLRKQLINQPIDRQTVKLKRVGIHSNQIVRLFFKYKEQFTVNLAKYNSQNKPSSDQKDQTDFIKQIYSLQDRLIQLAKSYYQSSDKKRKTVMREILDTNIIKAIYSIENMFYKPVDIQYKIQPQSLKTSVNKICSIVNGKLTSNNKGHYILKYYFENHTISIQGTRASFDTLVLQQ